MRSTTRLLEIAFVGMFLAFHLLSVPLLAEPTVRLWEEPLVLPTYQLGASERNPIFYSGESHQRTKGPIYPYALIDNLTGDRKDQSYNAVYLENQYVRLCVLPEIGGRLFGAIDKTNDYDFFYRQHVIKPAFIGMVGAWISGGVEWNIPQHHRISTHTMVDYTLKENPDGSKTIWIGEMERHHRMRWIIGITLLPDKSYVKITGKLFNATPVANSMMYFANAAVHAGPGYQVIFPPSVQYATFHAKEQFTRWPISHSIFKSIDYTRGVDLSWWKNHPAPISLFAWSGKGDFLAGYDHSKKAGVIHVADRHTMPGNKFFEWGNGTQGQMWDKILTDTDGPYLELMTGAYSDNQPDFSWCQPYETRTFTEYWYPLRELGGVKGANHHAAVNLEVVPGKSVKIGFNASSEHEDAKVVLQNTNNTNKILFEETIDISPAKPYVKEIPLPAGVREKDLLVSLFASDDEKLISYCPVEKTPEPAPDPVVPPPDPNDVATIDELYHIGLRLQQLYNPVLEPDPYFEEALERDPEDYRANTALGILYCKRKRFKEAEEKLNSAVKRATYNYTRPKDGEALYYLGVALQAQGKDDAACEAFHKATWCFGFRSASYYALAELASRKGDYENALVFLNRSLVTNGHNLKALGLKIVMLRKLNRLQEAADLAKTVMAIHALDFWAANESALVSAQMGSSSESARALNAVNKLMRDDAQNYLELAVCYGNCGLPDEAIEVLSRYVDRQRADSRVYPLIHYYLGYYWGQKGDTNKASQYYELGGKMSPDYCFPFRVETIDVLRSAMKRNPRDARAPYYLGNLLYDDQPKQALRAWERSKQLDGSFSIIHRNLGLAYAKVEKDIPKAITSFERAVACNPNDPMLYKELDEMYAAGRIAHRKRLTLMGKNHQAIVKRDGALFREIMLHVQVGEYDRAIDLFRGHEFHIWEHGAEMRQLYVDAFLFRGERYLQARQFQAALNDFKAALEYPENMQIGKPYNEGWDGKTYYWIGRTYEAMGDRPRARMFFEKATAAKHNWTNVRYYQGLAYRKLGQDVKADQVFNGLLAFGREKLKGKSAPDYFNQLSRGKQYLSDGHLKMNATYLMGLGFLGMGDVEKAKMQFAKVLDYDFDHIGARRQLCKAD